MHTNTPGVFVFLLHLVWIWRYSQVVAGVMAGRQPFMCYIHYLVKSSPFHSFPFFLSLSLTFGLLFHFRILGLLFSLPFLSFFFFIPRTNSHSNPLFFYPFPHLFLHYYYDCCTCSRCRNGRDRTTHQKETKVLKYFLFTSTETNW